MRISRTIEVQSFPRLVNDMMDYRPQTVTDAQFSLPWTLTAIAAGLPPVPTGMQKTICKTPPCWRWRIKSRPLSRLNLHNE
ncbi:hypothetical protein LNO81_11770 [Klebsiella variicola subsp. variicola]|nr:hypothetical protein [Klebsiella variicola subsp. variicola]